MTLTVLCDITCQNTEANLQPANFISEILRVLSYAQYYLLIFVLNYPPFSSYEIFKQKAYRIPLERHQSRTLYLNILC